MPPSRVLVRPAAAALSAVAAVAALLLLAGAAAAATPSSRCGQPATLASGDRTVDVPGHGDRTYYLQVPSSYQSGNPYPLVFAYHPLGTFEVTGVPGATDWHDLFCSSWYGNFRSVFGASNAVIVCPLAIKSGSTWSWDHTSDLGFFDAMLEDLSTGLCIDLDRVFVTGHSMGAMEANDLGCQRGDVIRAIAPVAGTGPNTCSSQTGQVAALVMHGTGDSVVGVAGGQASRDHWRDENGCSTGTTSLSPGDGNCSTHFEYQGCDAGYPVRWCAWNGYDHNDYWAIPSTFPITPPAEVDDDVAAETMWDFFNGLPAPGPAQVSLFADGFETGLGPWSGSFGPVSASSQADNGGSQGLLVDVDATCAGDIDRVVEPPPATVTGDFEACNSLVAQGVEIDGGGFTAGSMIGLGNSFSVASASTFSAALDPSLAAWAYVWDDTPGTVDDYGATLSIDPGPLSIDPAAEIDLLTGEDSTGFVLFRLVLRWHGGLGEHRLALYGREDGGAWVEHSTDFLLPDNTWSDVEIEWSSGHGDGSLLLSVGGATLSGITTLDNPGARLDRIRLGFAGGTAGGTGGEIHLDDFASWTFE